MKYISTRGGGQPQNFETVLLAGMAPDGGLYVPESWPSVDISALKGKPYSEVAFAVMYPFVGACIPADDFKEMVEQTYAGATFRHKDVVPLHHLKDNIYIMELFHGPTIAFKDIALQLLGRLFDYVLKQRKERITIVGATSGDTGSAAIEGCKACEQADMFILHPRGRVSDVQRKQMTTIDAPNVYNIAVDGSFDDCQNMVKAMFADEEFRGAINLSAINSINWARIMAQIVYYYTSALSLGAPDKSISYVVPTGNFGDIFAAYSAQKMGLPIKSLCVASNKNDILTRFFESGTMHIDKSYQTLSPSMDIQISSNFERYLFDLLGRNAERLNSVMNSFKENGTFAVSEEHLQKARAQFTASRADDKTTLALIKEVYNTTDYILDPHTAVGMEGVKTLAKELGADEPVALLATAHPAKFPDAVEDAIGLRPPLPEHLADLFDREEILSELPNDLPSVMDYVRTRTKTMN